MAYAAATRRKETLVVVGLGHHIHVHVDNEKIEKAFFRFCSDDICYSSKTPTYIHTSNMILFHNYVLFRSPSKAYGTYTMYTGTFQQPHFYREGEGWDPSYTQVRNSLVVAAYSLCCTPIVPSSFLDVHNR